MVFSICVSIRMVYVLYSIVECGLHIFWLFECLLQFFLHVYSFVQKPHKGVKFLQERGLLGKETLDVATFFYEDDRLDRVC